VLLLLLLLWGEHVLLLLLLLLLLPLLFEKPFQRISLEWYYRGTEMCRGVYVQEHRGVWPKVVLRSSSCCIWATQFSRCFLCTPLIIFVVWCEGVKPCFPL
jgi:hypothetical protein